MRYPNLERLARLYGDNAALDYVGDQWGNEGGPITPREAIDLHKQLQWSDQDYQVMIAHTPGDAVLKTGNGQTILALPSEQTGPDAVLTAACSSGDCRDCPDIEANICECRCHLEDRA